MSTPDRAEISRRNGQKSMGPKTIEGKNRSRLNAVKHGMTATLPVMPGEDGEALLGRIDAWTEDLQPRSLLEGQYIEQAAQISWQLARINRAHVARLTTNVQNAQAGGEQSLLTEREVVALGDRLFSDRRGPLEMYATFAFRRDDGPRTSWSGLADDPDNPVALIKQLESTLAGCGWMLDRWAELRARLEPGKAWQSPEKLMAIRLLGKQPLDAAANADVLTIFLACHAIDPLHPSAFQELKSETTDWEWKHYEKRLVRRTLELSCPSNESDGREALSQIVARATGQLELKAEAHRQRAKLDATLVADRLAFDDSAEGELLRRYETTCSRSLYKAVDSIVKMRLVANDRDNLIADQTAPIAAIEVDPEFLNGEDHFADSTNHPVVSTTPIVTQPEFTHSTNVANSDIGPAREPITTIEDSALQNEPSPTADQAILRNEPSPAADQAILRNEPSPAADQPYSSIASSRSAEHPTSASGDTAASRSRREMRRKTRKGGRDRQRRNAAANANLHAGDRGPMRTTATST
jgi:hypothetical protein